MYEKVIKRFLDVIMAFVLFIISLPILFVSAIAIKLDSKGKIIFKQKRVGKDGQVFYIYKLRTMSKDKNGVNKVTKVGKFLRITSIDELPQFINIIKGDMSFIGPRPWIESYSKYFTNEDKRRWEVLPGISGYAQVNGRNGMTIKEKIAADIWYVDNISFLTDLKILFKTVNIVIKKDGASISEKGIRDELKELEKMYNERMNIDSELQKRSVG